jgi:hypothetical protein
MAIKRTHDVVATVGTYKDRDGNEKKRYVNCGSAFLDDSGRMSIKLETIPVSPEWSGWVSLYAVEKRDAPAPAAADRYRGAPDGPDGEDIPF